MQKKDSKLVSIERYDGFPLRSVDAVKNDVLPTKLDQAVRPGKK